MHYELSENEFNQLEKTLRQMRFFTDLLAPVEMRMNQVSSTDMAAFVEAQQACLTTVLDAVHSRWEAQRAMRPVTEAPAAKTQPRKRARLTAGAA